MESSLPSIFVLLCLMVKKLTWPIGAVSTDGFETKRFDNPDENVNFDNEFNIIKDYFDFELIELADL